MVHKEKKYPLFLTGFSGVFKGVFKDDMPPLAIEDVLMEIQAIMCYEEDGILRGNILVVIAREDFGEEPFNIQLYSEKYDSPYHTIGYNAVRTLKNVRLNEVVCKDNADSYDKFIDFTAEEDTGWEEIDFTYGPDE